MLRSHPSLMPAARRLLVGLSLSLGWCIGAATHAEVVKQTVDYSHDGVHYRGVLVYDDAVATADAPRPGVLVLPEWWGRNDYAIGRAERLAELGYVALAADLYGLDSNTGEVKVTTDGAQAQQWSAMLYNDRARFRAVANAALRALAGQDTVDDEKLAAIGYCFGGTAAVELAYSGADVDAVVSFHGSVMTPLPGDDLANVRPAVLICHGVADPLYGLDQLANVISALERGGVDYAAVGFGGAAHSFTNPSADGSFNPGVMYDERADRRSWELMKVWFDDAFE